jgi:hypothetical protein
VLLEQFFNILAMPQCEYTIKTDKYCLVFWRGGCYMKQISAKERQKYLNERLRHIVKHAYDNAPTIKQKFDAAATICKEIEKRFSELCTVRLDKVECVPRGAIAVEAKIISDQRK